VTEVPLLPEVYPKNESSYTYVCVEKDGLTTFEVIGILKKELGIDFSDLNSEGLKDENAITTQIISVRKILSDRDVKRINKIYSVNKKSFSILNIIGHGKSPVQERMLHGNLFRLTIRDLANVWAKKFVEYCQSNRFVFTVNYYDNQRFGMAGGPYNTHLIGKALVEQKWKIALRELAKTKNEEIYGLMSKYNNGAESILRELNPKKLLFYVSSYNSYLWNNEVSKTLKKINGNNTVKYPFKNVGELYIPHGKGCLFSEIVSTSGYSFDVKNFISCKKQIDRNLFISTAVHTTKPMSDPLHKGKYMIDASFFLPTGSYATMFINQIFIKLKLS